MDEPLNLVNLPDLVLEEIFKNCLPSVNELKLCCKFLKEFIEDHPRLKKPPLNKLHIYIQPCMYDYDELKEVLLEQYNSTEIYESVEIEYDSEYESYKHGYDSEEQNPEVTVKVSNPISKN